MADVRAFFTLSPYVRIEGHCLRSVHVQTARSQCTLGAIPKRNTRSYTFTRDLRRQFFGHSAHLYRAPSSPLIPVHSGYAAVALFGRNDGSKGKPSFQLLNSAPSSLRRWGWIGFWGQFILSVVSGLVLLFSRLFSSPEAAEMAASAGATNGLGIALTIAGVVVSFIHCFWSYGYTRLGENILGREKKLEETYDPLDASATVESAQVQSESVRRDALRLLTAGVTISLIGMFITLIGSEAIVGILLAKALSQGVTITGWGGPIRVVQALDIFVVQANTNTLFSHMLGLIVPLRLLNKINNAKGPKVPA